MADAAPPPPSSAAPSAAPASAPTASPALALAVADAAPVVPEWVPEALKGDWGKPEYVEKATKAYAETHAKLSTRNDDFRKQVAAELEAERAKARPETPDGYDVKIRPGSDAEMKLKQLGVTLVDELTENSQEGAYVLSKDSETVAKFREFSFRHNIPADAFAEMVEHVIVRDVARDKRARELQNEVWAKQDAAELAKLGPNGKARKDAAAAGIKAQMVQMLGKEKGEEAGRALADATCFAGGVEGLETLLNAVSGGLAPGGAADGASGVRPADLMFPQYARK